MNCLKQSGAVNLFCKLFCRHFQSIGSRHSHKTQTADLTLITQVLSQKQGGLCCCITSDGAKSHRACAVDDLCSFWTQAQQGARADTQATEHTQHFSDSKYRTYSSKAISLSNKITSKSVI